MNCGKRIKKVVGLLVLVLYSSVLVGCGQKMIRSPYDSSHYQGKDHEVVLGELQDAGFTNIQSIPHFSHFPEDAKKVSGVTIGPDTSFNTTYSWKTDVLVIIDYYEYIEEEQGDLYTADVESIKQLAQDRFRFEYDNLEVSFDEESNQFIVSYLPTRPPLSETDYLRDNVNRYINFCRFAYDVEGVEGICFDVKTAARDQYGNDAVIDALYLYMTKDTFGKYNWGNLELERIWGSFAENCDVLELAPLFEGKIEASEVFYEPPFDGLIW